MPYTVRILFLTQGEPPPTEQMDGTFGSVVEAHDAGTAEVLAYQLKSVETAFQVLDASGNVVDMTAEQ